MVVHLHLDARDSARRVQGLLPNLNVPVTSRMPGKVPSACSDQSKVVTSILQQ